MPIRLDTNGVVFPNYKNDMTKKCHNSLFNASARSVGKSSTDPRSLAAHWIAGLSLILAVTVTATTAGQRRTDRRMELLKQYRALHSLYADAR